MDEELDLKDVLLAEAELCLDHGDPEGALHSAEEALRLDGRMAGAHHLRAVALRELGQLEPALQAAQQALELDPASGEAAFTLAELLIFDAGDPPQGLELCDQFLREELEDTLYADFLNLKGNALCELGELEGALGCFDRAAELNPEREDVASRGWALFELGRLEEARDALQLACQPGPFQNPANHFYLAVTLSRLGDERGAGRHFRIASRLEPDQYHLPHAFPPDQILAAAEQVLASLPANLVGGLAGVPRVVVDWPELAELGEGPDRLSPLALVELVNVERAAARSLGDEEREETYGASRWTSTSPARPPVVLKLFSRNLSFACRDRETMQEELYLALWQSLVQFLDLTSAELDGHGLH